MHVTMDTFAMTMTLETIPSRLNRLVGTIPTAENKDYAEILMNVPAIILELTYVSRSTANLKRQNKL